METVGRVLRVIGVVWLKEGWVGTLRRWGNVIGTIFLELLASKRRWNGGRILVPMEFRCVQRCSICLVTR